MSSTKPLLRKPALFSVQITTTYFKYQKLTYRVTLELFSDQQMRNPAYLLVGCDISSQKWTHSACIYTYLYTNVASICQTNWKKWDQNKDLVGYLKAIRRIMCGLFHLIYTSANTLGGCDLDSFGKWQGMYQHIETLFTFICCFVWRHLIGLQQIELLVYLYLLYHLGQFRCSECVINCSKFQFVWMVKEQGSHLCILVGNTILCVYVFIVNLYLALTLWFFREPAYQRRK